MLSATHELNHDGSFNAQRSTLHTQQDCRHLSCEGAGRDRLAAATHVVDENVGNMRSYYQPTLAIRTQVMHSTKASVTQQARGGRGRSAKQQQQQTRSLLCSTPLRQPPAAMHSTKALVTLRLRRNPWFISITIYVNVLICQLYAVYNPLCESHIKRLRSIHKLNEQF